MFRRAITGDDIGLALAASAPSAEKRGINARRFDGFCHQFVRRNFRRGHGIWVKPSETRFALRLRENDIRDFAVFAAFDL